jgi:hypothetical protein
MKVVFSSAALLFSAAYASYHSMEEQLQELLNSVNSTVAGERALGELLGPTLAAINEYGCWCYFEEDHGKGKSQPLNEIDSYCKILHEGYDCAMMDAEEAGEPECEPWEVTYVTQTTSDIDTLIQVCTNLNADKCARNACIVEGMFVVNIVQSFFAGISLDPIYKHTDPDFDLGVMCPTKPGPQSVGKSCCGFYPFRRPYKTYEGNRSCCGVKTYDTNILTCCADGKPRMSC